MRTWDFIVIDEGATLTNRQLDQLSQSTTVRSCSACAPPDACARVSDRASRRFIQAPDVGHKFPFHVIWLLIGMVLGYVLRDVVTIQESRAVESARWR